MRREDADAERRGHGDARHLGVLPHPMGVFGGLRLCMAHSGGIGFSIHLPQVCMAVLGLSAGSGEGFGDLAPTRLPATQQSTFPPCKHILNLNCTALEGGRQAGNCAGTRTGECATLTHDS